MRLADRHDTTRFLSFPAEHPGFVAFTRRSDLLAPRRADVRSYPGPVCPGAVFVARAGRMVDVRGNRARLGRQPCCGCDPRQLGRVMSISMSLNAAGFPIGSAIAGTLAATSSSAALMMAGIASAMAALATSAIPHDLTRARTGKESGWPSATPDRIGMPRVPVPYLTRLFPNSLELAEIHFFFDELPRQQERSFDVRDYGQVIDRRGDEQRPDVVVYFIVAPRIRPIAEIAILKQRDPGFIKAVRMRYLDGMQCTLQDRSDVWKMIRAMVFQYLDQKIATVIYRPNPESNQVCHGSFLFPCTGVERPLVSGRGRRGQSTSCLGTRHFPERRTVCNRA